MKRFTRPRLVAAATVMAAVAIGIWLDRRDKMDVKIQKGVVAIDESFLHRLKTEDARTTRDPAIKTVLTQLRGDPVVVDELKRGALQLVITRPDGDMVNVFVTSGERGWGFSGETHHFMRHRQARWSRFSRNWWEEEVLHRPYWDYAGSSMIYE